jgi:dTDP-4-amino-4,6-dideoxygalactose transaminase
MPETGLQRINKRSSIAELAIFSGRPAFRKLLYVGCPNIPDRKKLLRRINAMLDRRWLTNRGPCVLELESKIANMVGVKHCIATCNGTLALIIAVRALQLSGEVIIPAFTFISTAHALQWEGIKPVFCDVEPRSHNLDVSQLENLITSRTTGVIPVHLWGRPCNIDQLTLVTKKHNLNLLFDAAHAFACSYRGQMIGNFGDAEIFSFHATKYFNTFEGGAVVTNDDNLADRLRLMKNFGFRGFDNVISLGINAKMNEVAAVMGLTNLEYIDDFITVNHRHYHQYRNELSNVPGIRFITFDEEEKNNYQYIVLEIDKNVAKMSRDDFVTVLHAENVIARRYFYPGCHNMEPYRSLYPDARVTLPETEKLTDKVLCLPTGTAVKHKDISRICQIIRFIATNGEEIKIRLLEIDYKNRNAKTVM